VDWAGRGVLPALRTRTNNDQLRTPAGRRGLAARAHRDRRAGLDPEKPGRIPLVKRSSTPANLPALLVITCGGLWITLSPGITDGAVDIGPLLVGLAPVHAWNLRADQAAAHFANIVAKVAAVARPSGPSPAISDLLWDGQRSGQDYAAADQPDPGRSFLQRAPDETATARSASLVAVQITRERRAGQIGSRPSPVTTRAACCWLFQARAKWANRRESGE